MFDSEFGPNGHLVVTDLKQGTTTDNSVDPCCVVGSHTTCQVRLILVVVHLK